MKKYLFLTVFLLGFFFSGKLFAVPDSCLTLYCPNDGVNYNPDLIQVDTCSGSPTYGDWFQKGTWTIGFSRFFLRDSSEIIKYGKTAQVKDIDSINFPLVYTAYKLLENKFGEITFKRDNYACTHYSDSSFYSEPCLNIYFKKISRTKEVEYNLNQLPEIKFVRMTNYPVKSVVPASCLTLLWQHDPEHGYINACGIKKDTCKDSKTFNDWFLSHTLLMSMNKYIFSKLILVAHGATVDDIDTTKYLNIRDSIRLLEKKYGRIQFFREPYECANQWDEDFQKYPCLDISFPKYNKMNDVLDDLRKLSITNAIMLSSYCYAYNEIEDNYTQPMEIKPNPCFEQLQIKNIENKTNFATKIVIYNYLGDVVITHSIPGEAQNSEIDVSALSTGVYFVRVGNKVSKFVKV